MESGPYTYSWSPTTGLSNPNIAQPTASPTTTTTYTLTVHDSLAQSATDTATVTVASGVVADAGPDKTIASGGSTTLQGAASGGVGPYTYSWSPATGLNNANIAQPTASPTTTTTYTLTVHDSLAQSATDSATVTVASAVVADAGPDQDHRLGRLDHPAGRGLGGSGALHLLVVAGYRAEQCQHRPAHGLAYHDHHLHLDRARQPGPDRHRHAPR